MRLVGYAFLKTAVLLQGVRHHLVPFVDRDNQTSTAPQFVSSPRPGQDSKGDSSPDRLSCSKQPRREPKPWERHAEAVQSVAKEGTQEPEAPVNSEPARQNVPSSDLADTSDADFASFVRLVKQKRPTLSGTLALVRPLDFGPGRVRLGCDSAFDLSTIGSDEVKKYLGELLSSFFGQRTELALERLSRRKRGEWGSLPQTLDEADVNLREQAQQAKIKEAKLRPAVKAVREELNAEVGRIRVLDSESR